MQNGVGEWASFLWLLSGFLSVGYVLIGHIRNLCHLREAKKWIYIALFPSFFVYISDRSPNRMVSMDALIYKKKSAGICTLLLVRCLRLSHCPRSPNEQLQEAHAVRITTKYTYCKNKGVLRYLHTPQTSTVAFVLTSIQKLARFQTAKDKNVVNVFP